MREFTQKQILSSNAHPHLSLNLYVGNECELHLFTVSLSLFFAQSYQMASEDSKYAATDIDYFEKAFLSFSKITLCHNLLFVMFSPPPSGYITINGHVLHFKTGIRISFSSFPLHAFVLVFPTTIPLGSRSFKWPYTPCYWEKII